MTPEEELIRETHAAMMMFRGAVEKLEKRINQLQLRDMSHGLRIKHEVADGRNLPDTSKAGSSSEVGETADSLRAQVQGKTELRKDFGNSQEGIHGGDKGPEEDFRMGDGTKLKDITNPFKAEGKDPRTFWFRDPEIQFDFRLLDRYKGEPTTPLKIEYIQSYMANRKKPVISVDFDGVIHKHLFTQDFSTWFDLYTEMPLAIESMNELYKAGWYIIIHTLRNPSGDFLEWLNIRGIPYHDINGFRSRYTEGGWSHNPHFCGAKPMFDVMLDDRCLFYIDQFGTEENFPWAKVMESMKSKFPNMNWSKQPSDFQEYISRLGKAISSMK